MLGYCWVLLSSVFFCIQNVVVRVLFSAHPLLGFGVVGGYLAPTLQNSFLLLLLRMVLAVPLMAMVSGVLYPQTWRELAQLWTLQKRRVLLHAIAGGILMFLYLALLYVAIGLIATGVALTLFFTFPVFTALFSWGLLGQRPSPYRWGVMALVLVGSGLTVPQAQFSLADGNLWGVLLGVGSGVAYALYTVNAQKSFDHIHPVPFTGLSFTITLGLSVVAVVAWPRSPEALDWGPIWIGSLLSGIVTFAGHLLYNSGIRVIGATAASMIGSANPALTVVLAWATIQEVLTAIQVLGVAIVTGSVASLSCEHKS